MTKIRFTLQYGDDKPETWVFDDSRKLEKEIDKIISIMFFTRAMTETEIGKKLFKLSALTKGKKKG